MKSVPGLLPCVLVGGLLVAGCSGGHSSSGAFVVTPSDSQVRAQLAAASVSPPARPAPESAAMVALGKALFFDKVLSGNRNIACSTCHFPSAATGDSLSVSLGEGGVGTTANRQIGTGKQIPRNAPPVFNGGCPGVPSMFLDSRVKRDPATGALTTPEPALNGTAPVRSDMTAQLTTVLAAQAMFPVASRDEMRGQGTTNELASAPDNQTVWALLMARLVGTQNGTAGGIPAYRTLFLAAYPSVTSVDALTFAHAARAIAAFESDSWTALGTPFDAYLAGNDAALSDQQKRGAGLFYGRARCATCHSGPFLSDFQHHAICVPQLGPGKVDPNDDRGFALTSKSTADNYKFRTPHLRNVEVTGPWGHDGAFTTLEAMVRHHLDPVKSATSYDRSQLRADFAASVDTDPTRQAARLAALDPTVTPVTLADSEVGDLVAFLKALTDPTSFNNPKDTPPTSVPSGLPVAD